MRRPQRILGAAFLILGMGLVHGCSDRPSAVSVADFEARHPKVLVVLPVAFVATGKSPLHHSLEQNYFQGVEYATRLRATLASTDLALQLLRKNAEDKFRAQEIHVVDRERTDRWLKRMMGSGSLNVRQMAGALGADSVAFLSLYEWDFANEIGFQQRGTLRAQFEVTIMNVTRGDLIWIDQSHPGEFHYATVNKEVAVKQLSEQVVDAAFKSYPTKRAPSQPPADAK